MFQMPLHVTTIIKGRGILEGYSFFLMVSVFSVVFHDLFWSSWRSFLKVLKDVSEMTDSEGTISSPCIFSPMFWLLCVWLRYVCNWLGVFWNRNGPRCSHGRAGAGRRPQCDPDGVGVREGQPSCASSGLRGHWQSCRCPGLCPQAHGWHGVSSGTMLLLPGLPCWQAPANPCLTLLGSFLMLLVMMPLWSFASFNFCGKRMEFLSSLPQTSAEIIILPNLLWLFWRQKIACS